MPSNISRRAFVKASAAAGVTAPMLNKRAGFAAEAGPVVIASANGLRAVTKAYQMITADKADTLEAVIAGVNINEDDPDDNSVGYGGLPNEEGVVELDSSVMHGPSRRSGAVAALRDVRNPSKVAHAVLKRTDHALLVGEGALRFALAHGFNRENLLTEKSRIAWLAWKERMSDRDNWGPGLATPDGEEEQGRRVSAFLKEQRRPELEAWVLDVLRHPPYGTINCLALNARGDISGVTTTSGLAWKLPGRVGDSPLIGCGLFVDNDVGAAGSTGRGEEAIKTCGAHTVVEAMRRGASPNDACLEALRRVAANYSSSKEKLSRFNITFYALNKKGEHGAAALWSESWRIDRMTKSQYVVHDAQGARHANAAYLFERRG